MGKIKGMTGVHTKMRVLKPLVYLFPNTITNLMEVDAMISLQTLTCETKDMGFVVAVDEIGLELGKVAINDFVREEPISLIE